MLISAYCNLKRDGSLSFLTLTLFRLTLNNSFLVHVKALIKPLYCFCSFCPARVSRLCRLSLQTQNTQEKSRAPQPCSLLNIHTTNCVTADAHTEAAGSHYRCPNLQCVRCSHRHTKWRALCYPKAVCGFTSSMVITLLYAQRSLPATRHPSHIFLPCSTRASLASSPMTY